MKFNICERDKTKLSKRGAEVRQDREHQEQAALFRWAELNRVKHPALSLMFAIPNGGHRHKAVAGKLKAEGVKPGVPDIFLPWPSNNKSGLFVELKAPSGQISPAQRVWNLNLACHYQAEFCFGWIEAAKTICEYLGVKCEL